MILVEIVKLKKKLLSLRTRLSLKLGMQLKQGTQDDRRDAGNMKGCGALLGNR